MAGRRPAAQQLRRREDHRRPPRHPDLQRRTAQRITGTTDASAYRALGRLTTAAVLEVLSESKRNQIWAATGALAELDALSTTIGRRTSEHL